MQSKRRPPNAAVRQWLMAQRARRCSVRSGGRVLRNSGRKRRSACRTVAGTGVSGAGAPELTRQPAAQLVHQTQGILGGLVGQVQVDHRGGDLLVTEQSLDGVQMGAGLQKMSGKGMTQ